MGFSVSCKELPLLMRDLRAVDRNLANEMKRHIRAAEAPAKRVMQAAALSAPIGPMAKAARAVRTNNRFSGKTAVLKLRIDAGIAPNARPLDKGSRGSGGAYDRHPVFGFHRRRRRVVGFLGFTKDTTVRVNQPTRPFFDKGADAAFRECENEMEEALFAVVRALS